MQKLVQRVEFIKKREREREREALYLLSEKIYTKGSPKTKRK